MKTSGRRILPHWTNALLALLSALLLTLSFPDFEIWILAWVALVPLMWAIEREACGYRNFILGWLFGTGYFFGTCWWLTYAPIHYAAMPWPIAYLLILIACGLAGIFPAIFASVLTCLLRKFGTWAFLLAPFVWVATEFARYWITGNDWDAIGYSQAFSGVGLRSAGWGGVLLTSAIVLTSSALITRLFFLRRDIQTHRGTVKLLSDPTKDWRLRIVGGFFGAFLVSVPVSIFLLDPVVSSQITKGSVSVVAVQPNVPMSGLQPSAQLQARQFDLAGAEIRGVRTIDSERPVVVVLPEAPMDYTYGGDREFQHFLRDFTTKNNVAVLFNSSEPDTETGKYFNSAVMVGPLGNEVAEYDKIYLLPFGEAVPVPFEGLMPALVGSFSYGRNYPLLPVGDAKAGVMICFESHFGQLSRHYVADGADLLIEMTNDGYLGPTPVLRQHLANAVFRAVETDRPVLRVTNVGITAYISEAGNVLDPLPSYTEGTRVWPVGRSDGSKTLYVRYGDWFAWLSVLLTIAMLTLSARRRRDAGNDLSSKRAAVPIQ